MSNNNKLTIHQDSAPTLPIAIGIICTLLTYVIFELLYRQDIKFPLRYIDQIALVIIFITCIIAIFKVANHIDKKSSLEFSNNEIKLKKFSILKNKYSSQSIEKHKIRSIIFIPSALLIYTKDGQEIYFRTNPGTHYQNEITKHFKGLKEISIYWNYKLQLGTPDLSSKSLAKLYKALEKQAFAADEVSISRVSKQKIKILANTKQTYWKLERRQKVNNTAESSLLYKDRPVFHFLNFIENNWLMTLVFDSSFQIIAAGQWTENFISGSEFNLYFDTKSMIWLNGEYQTTQQRDNKSLVIDRSVNRQRIKFPNKNSQEDVFDLLVSVAIALNLSSNLTTD